MWSIKASPQVDGKYRNKHTELLETGIAVGTIKKTTRNPVNGSSPTEISDDLDLKIFFAA